MQPEQGGSLWSRRRAKRGLRYIRMTNAVERVWVVRGGDNNELASQVKTKHAVALGWANVPDIHGAASRDHLRHLMEEASPGSATPNAVGQLYRFLSDIAVGDYVLTPEKATSTIHVSKCMGDYRYDASVFGESYAHVRPVEYLKTVPRSAFPQTVRNTLGSVLTVFRADIALPYVRALLGLGESLPAPTDDTAGDPGVWADEIDGQARGQILEALDNIDHHDFQLFIAGLLEAMGYKAHPGGRERTAESIFLPTGTPLASKPLASRFRSRIRRGQRASQMSVTCTVSSDRERADCSCAPGASARTQKTRRL